MSEMLVRQDPASPEPVAAGPSVDLSEFRERSLNKGVNPVFYRVIRAMFVPFFLVYFRMQRVGREHLPRSGPLLLASNHRSFLDPFVIGTLVKRPVYYMAKRELFEKRWQAWALNALGAFPVDRGAGDRDAMETARAILARGDCVVVFPEGTRVRRYPTVENCSPALATAVTERIWACVSLQWDWLGGTEAATPAQIDEAPRREISRAA
jgi:1-acyl-sn-glycerol-3-phosphate acyltransferase